MVVASRTVAADPVPVPAAFRQVPRFAALVTAAIAVAGLLAAVLGHGAAPVTAQPQAWDLPRFWPALAFLLAAAAVALPPLTRPGRLMAALAGAAGISLFAVILLHLGQPAPTQIALYLTLLGISFLTKRVLPRFAAGLDIFVVFVAFLIFLSRLFAAPVAATAKPGSQVAFLSAVCLLLLPLGWLAAFPHQRPAAYFLERGSAGALLRRILPLTLVFPLLLVWSQFETRHAAKVMAQIGGSAFLLGVIIFWVALIFIISGSLDRLDSSHAAARVKLERDFAERTAARQKLNDSEEQVRLLLDSTGEGIFYSGMDGNCLWSNTSAARLLGHDDRAMLLGRNMHQLAHHSYPDGRPMPASECPLQIAAEKGEGTSVDEMTLWRADGSAFYADVRSYPVLREGRATGMIMTFNDVSRRRQLEDQMRQTQKMEAVGRLAAGVAHDFNNLLTVINGYSDLLLSGNAVAGPVRDKLTNVRKAGEKAADLTRQLLAFSRQQVLQPKVLDVNAVIVDIDKLLKRVIGEDIALESVLAADLSSVRADPGQLQQVIMNLAVNARDAMPDGGTLTIETARVELDAAYTATHPWAVPGPYVMLAVTDTGIGMDAETKAHAFEPFFTTKAAGKGTGLGLATVFGIVKQSGGLVAIYSEPGHGTSFKVYLPCINEPATATRHATADAAAPRGRETVLLVEDESEVGELLVDLLSTAGYTVLRATSGEHALQLDQEHHGSVDLLISDVILPGMSGREVVRQITARRPQTRVLFISGYPDKAIVRNGDIEAGLAFIQKPFTPAALIHKVREVLDAALA